MQLLFADQLGQHFDLGGEILLPEVLSQFRKRRYHRQKAHLILYAIRARARDERVNLIQLDNYRDLAERTDLEVVVSPTSRPMLALAESLNIEIKAARGFCSSKSQFEAFAGDKKRLRLEDF
ncbi:MAG: cryptochrome/photolyase family protein, partial [Aquiluna sp.]|nr:cryptochrome/photolyase family protein [Aquiluna sp.]